MTTHDGNDDHTHTDDHTDDDARASFDDARASFRDGDTGRDRRSKVTATARVAPHLVRITLAGDIDDLIDNGGDQHVTVNFFPDDALVPFPLPPGIAAELHRFVRPRMHRYTIRRCYDGDDGRRRVEFDAVVHADGGPGSRWAGGVAVDVLVWWWGPTEGWQPRPATRTLLLAGDETAFPAIEAIVREAPMRCGPSWSSKPVTREN